ncbi:MAG: putative Ig domain-containing protein [Acidobacteriota bacterium]
MRNAWKRAGVLPLALASIVLSCAGSALSSTFTIPSDDELIVGARAIVRGKVLSISSQLDPQQDRIFTYVTIRVHEVLKGQIASLKIVLKEEGGQAGTRGSIVFGTPEFKRGEEVLVYLDTWRDGSLRVHQMLLGKFTVVDDPDLGTKVVVRDLKERSDARVAFKADALNSGIATDYAPLSAYSAMVRSRLAANWDRSEQFLQNSYRDVSVHARPPEYHAPSGDELHSDFNFYPQSQPARWFAPDALQPVVFFVNPDSAPNPQIVDDAAAAMNAWSNVPNSTLRIVNGGATGVCYSGAQNTILFSGCDGRFSPTPECARILALGGLHWDSASTRVINGVTFVEASGGFVSFNPYASCEFGNHCNVQEIATHELGHGLGLGHSEFPDGTMFGVAHFDGRCASIRQDDVDAIAFVYPTQNGPGTPLTITTTSLPTGVLGVTYPPHNIVATGGSRPYRWEVAAELGRLPQGMSLAGIGVVNGQPSQTGVFNFTALVRDRTGAEVQKALSLTVVAPSGPYDSQFVSQTVPTALNIGQQFSVNMKWLNIGTQVWDPSSGVRVRSQNPANNTIWGGSTLIPAGGVLPGQQLNLTFTATAPAAGGSYSFQWQLSQDGTSLFGQTSANVSIVVTDPNPPSVSSPSSVAAVQGSPFTFQLTVAGGTPPFTWSVASGTLPAGLGLNPTTGAVTGTPTALGDFAVSFKATDAQSRSAQKLITITVGPPVLTITTGAIPAAQKGAAFTFQLAAAGGKPPYKWALTTGALPAGLLLSGTTGVIAGTPLAVGGFGFTVDVTDSDSHSFRKALSLTVTPPPLSLSTAASVDAMKGTAFNYQPTAAGGTPPYAWSISAGALPAGLILNANSGTLSGTPSQIGTFSFTLSVRDQSAATATAPIQIRVIDPETVPVITKVKYKPGKRQLIVNGDRVNPAAKLVVDGTATEATPDGRQFKLKKVTLTPGRHEIRIVNPGDISSPPFVLEVG